jgi:hypothetical protein
VADVPQPIPVNSPVGILHAWMRDALPVDSDAPKLGPREDEGGRIRCEPAPPNPLCIDLPGAPENFSAPAGATALQREMERADQLMLSAHNFVPGCSEFIVEWSWGDTYTTGPQVGQVIWHGLSRAVDLNGNGTLDHAAGEQVATTYICSVDDTGVTGVNPHAQRFVRKDGSIGHWWVQGLLVNTNEAGNFAGNSTDENIAYSYFGFINPTYRPAANPDDPLDMNPYTANNPGLLVDLNNNGQYNANDGDKYNDPETIPWPWPKLVRITMSLVDPSDPTIEQTYQFIFDLPGDPVDPRY